MRQRPRQWRHPVQTRPQWSEASVWRGINRATPPAGAAMRDRRCRMQRPTIAVPATNIALMNLEKGPAHPEGIKAFSDLAKLYTNSYLPPWMESFHSDTETLPCQKCGSPCFTFQSVIQVKTGNISRLMFEDSPCVRCETCRKYSGIVVGSTVEEVQRMM